MKFAASLACISSALTVGLGLQGCGDHGGKSARNPATVTVAVTGSTAPAFTGRDLEGHELALSSHLGKDVVLLDFYSTWCEPCVAELPHLRALYDAHRAKGFLIIAISLDGPETAANVPGFARRNRIPFPVIIDDDSRIATLYNPLKTAPMTILIDRSGKVVFTHRGYTPGDEDALVHAVTRAVDGRPTAIP